MIWPGRALGTVLLVPALLSLGVFISDDFIPAVVLIDVLVGGVAVADLLTLIGSGRMKVVRRCGRVCSLGERHEVLLEIENLGWSARRLRLKDDVPDTFEAEPSEFAINVPGRRLVELSYGATPKRRGTYPFRQVDALVLSRLGLWQRQVAWPAMTTVRVYPDIRQIARYTVLARRDRLSSIGVRNSRRLGTDNEFERLRDYVEGDEPRFMDWRSTARRGKLTVRAHQVNQSQRIIFMIDCGRMMAGDTGDGLSPLDHAFNAMLLLSHVAMLRGDQVGLLAFSDRIRAFVPPTGGSRKIRGLVHQVHNIFPELVESRYDRAFLELEKRCRKRSLVILMTNLFDDMTAGLIAEYLGNLRGHHLPLGVFLRDHDLFRLADSEPTNRVGYYQSAAAAQILNWRERVVTGLSRHGTLTLDVFPEELTASLVNRYLQIKARHLL